MDWNLCTAARTLFQEARGEPLDGQEAVAHVLVNRLHTGRWGHSLGEVCLWYAQFSGWLRPPHDPNFSPACRLPDTDPQLQSFAALIQAALDGKPDPTGQATHYFAKAIPAPPWTQGATFCGQFGHQLFYKSVP